MLSVVREDIATVLARTVTVAPKRRADHHSGQRFTAWPRPSDPGGETRRLFRGRSSPERARPWDEISPAFCLRPAADGLAQRDSWLSAATSAAASERRPDQAATLDDFAADAQWSSLRSAGVRTSTLGSQHRQAREGGWIAMLLASKRIVAALALPLRRLSQTRAQNSNASACKDPSAFGSRRPAKQILEADIEHGLRSSLGSAVDTPVYKAHVRAGTCPVEDAPAGNRRPGRTDKDVASYHGEQLAQLARRHETARTELARPG